MVVCFTGHRDLGSPDEALAIRHALDARLYRLIEVGATVFRAGGALGFDTLAALAVLDARHEFPSLRLELILPCPDQCARWNAYQIEQYRQILTAADSHTYLAPAYYRGVMHERNRALVNGADVCVAFLRAGCGGGTAYTVDYAKRRGVPVINLANDL